MDEFRTKCTQVESEFQAWLDIIQKEGVRKYLEIGSRWGGSLWRAANVLPKGSWVVSVDSGKGMGGGKRGAVDSLRACITELNKTGCKAHFIKGHSQSDSVVNAVKRLGPFDAVFIDGDHEYDGVRKDWKIYGPMARVVGFHDTAWVRPANYSPDVKQVEVGRLWNEIKDEYRHEHFDGGGNMGIGVIWRA